MLRQLVHDNTIAKVKLSFKSERLLKPRMPLMLFIVALHYHLFVSFPFGLDKATMF